MGSANAAANTAGTDQFTEFVQAACDVYGPTFERYLRPSDMPGLLTPATIESDREYNGALLVVPDRAIIAWETGTFRRKNVESVIERSAIRSIERTKCAETAERYGYERVTIRAEKTWNLGFADHLFGGGPSVVPFVAGMLDGSIKPVFTTGSD